MFLVQGGSTAHSLAVGQRCLSEDLSLCSSTMAGTEISLSRKGQLACSFDPTAESFRKDVRARLYNYCNEREGLDRERLSGRDGRGGNSLSP